MTMKMTLTQLAIDSACDGQRQLFVDTFGHEEATSGVECTEENCLKAAAAGLDTWWCVINSWSNIRRGYRERNNRSLSSIGEEVFAKLESMAGDDYIAQTGKARAAGVPHTVRYHEAMALVAVAKALYDDMQASIGFGKREDTGAGEATVPAAAKEDAPTSD